MHAFNAFRIVSPTFLVIVSFEPKLETERHGEIFQVLLLFSFIFQKLGLEDSIGSLRLRIPLSEGLTKYARNETVDDDLPKKEDLGNTNDAYDNTGTSTF